MTTYIRKTRDQWEVQVNYGYGSGWEVECVEDRRAEGKEQLRTYLANCTYPVRLVKKRVPLNPPKAPVIQVRLLDRLYNPKLHITRGLGTVDGGNWFGTLTGTAQLLAKSLYTRDYHSTALGVLLDRLQEEPGEVEGLDARDVEDAVQWIRDFIREQPWP